MRSLLGKALPRSVALATLLACSEDVVSPSIMLALNTNDLVISSDTNLVGLYVAELDQNGRVLATQAHEAAPLRHADGTVEVPFPASLLLADATETRRVHVKLVAFRNDSRVPLTMRETRTQLPSSGQRLLRLNLFFTNQGNVVDSAPGTPVLEAATASGLGFRHAAGPIAHDQFARFTSLCDGAPAADGRTAGDDGRCVDLDIRVEDLPRRDDTSAPVPGASESDTCFDVGRAFAIWSDQVIGEIDRAALSALPTTGECRIDLPAVYEPTRLNVAMSTTENAFETHDNPFVADKPAAGSPGATQTLSLRPLPSGVSYRQEGNTIVVPEHVCAVLRRDEVQSLLFSQRTETWTGEEPVCAPWSHATVPHEFTGVAPGPLPPTDGGDPSDAGDDGGDGDGGDGGNAPAFADYALEPALMNTLSMAAGGGRVALGQLGENGHSVEVLEPARFAAYGVGPRGAIRPYPEEVYSSTLHAMQVGASTEFYSYDSESRTLWYVGPEIARMSGPWEDDTVVPAPLWDGPAVAWIATEPQRELRVQRLVEPDMVAATPLIAYPVDDTFGRLDNGFGVSFPSASPSTIPGTTIALPGNRTYVRCVGSACETVELPDDVPVTGFRSLAHTGGVTMALATPHDGSQNAWTFDFASLAVHDQGSWGSQLVAGGGFFCLAVDRVGNAQDVRCFAAPSGTSIQPFALVTGVFSAHLASDSQYLYATYKCSSTMEDAETAYVARMPWALVGQNPAAFVNRCTLGNEPDAGDGGDGGLPMPEAGTDVPVQ